MRKYNPPSHPILYHISDENHNNETFCPRIPQDAFNFEEEDMKTPRVCVSTSIMGCTRAIDPGEWIWENIDYYVHVPINLDELYDSNAVFEPNEKEVPDVKSTREKWILRPTKFHCIGVIHVHHPFFTKGYFNWIEKY